MSHYLHLHLHLQGGGSSCKPMSDDANANDVEEVRKELPSPETLPGTAAIDRCYFGAESNPLLNVTGLLECSSRDMPSRVNSLPVTMNALAQALRGKRDHPPQGTVGRHGQPASAGGSGGNTRIGMGLARTLGWQGILDSSSGSRDQISPTIGASQSGSLLVRENSPSACPNSIEDRFSLERKNSALLSMGHLGLDPREVAKLMSKNSTFVEVDGIEMPRRAQPVLRSRAGDSLRRHSDRADGSSGLYSRTYPGQGTDRSSTPSWACEDGRESQSKRGKRSQSSPGGFAFSCDPRAQEAEIAMILGEMDCPFKHAASFCKRRSSLRAQRLGHAENAGDVEDHVATPRGCGFSPPSTEELDSSLRHTSSHSTAGAHSLHMASSSPLLSPSAYGSNGNEYCQDSAGESNDDVAKGNHAREFPDDV